MSRETLENSSSQGKCPCDCSPIEALAQLSHLKQLVKNADRKKVIDSEFRLSKEFVFDTTMRRRNHGMSG